MENGIKVLKLITGEELITGVTEEQNGIFLIEYPMVVQQAAPDKDGRMGISLLPWSFSGKTEQVTLKTRDILAVLEATTEMHDNYNSAISYEKSQIKFPENVIKE
jgi:hypothetical protein